MDEFLVRRPTVMELPEGMEPFSRISPLAEVEAAGDIAAAVRDHSDPVRRTFGVLMWALMTITYVLGLIAGLVGIVATGIQAF